MGHVTGDLERVTCHLGRVTGNLGRVTGNIRCATSNLGHVTGNYRRVTGKFLGVTGKFSGVTLGVSLKKLRCDQQRSNTQCFSFKKKGHKLRSTLTGTCPCIMCRRRVIVLLLVLGSLMVHLVTWTTIAYCLHKPKSD